MRSLSLILLVSSLCSAQSNPPTPRTPQSSKTGEDGTAKGVASAQNNNPSTAPPQTIPKSRNVRGADSDGKKEQSPDGNPGDSVIAWATVIIAAATIAQAIIYGLQTRHMKQAIAETANATKVATRAMELANQARVGISSIVLRDAFPKYRTMDSDQTIGGCCVDIRFTNTGLTREKDFDVRLYLGVSGTNRFDTQSIRIQKGDV